MPDGAAIYTRISDDRAGDAAGVRRQEADCRALAEVRGWTIAAVYVDNDLGAWGTKRRPQYRQMLADIKAGHVDAVIVWHLDRLTRRPVELEEFFEVCDAAGIRDLASCTGDVDLSTNDGRFMARILGAVARKESDDHSRRTRRKHLELAEQGAAVGGSRPFGYDDDKVTVRPAEAALIREAAARVLAGDTLRSLCREWNDTAVATPRSGRWTATAIRKILLSARIVGKRSLGGVIIADAQWPAILDETTQAHVRAVLDARAITTGGFGPRTHLLTGLLRCGRCGTLLIARPQSARKRTYVCTSDPSKGGCGGIRIVAEGLEQLVTDRARDKLSSKTVARALAKSGHADEGDLIAELVADEAALEQWAIDQVEGRVTRAQFLAATQRLQRRLDGLRRRLGHLQASRVVAPFAGRPLTDGEWDALPFDRRRAVVEELVDEIRIGPAVPGRNWFDEKRVKIKWKN